MKLTANRIAGFTLVEIMVVVAIVGLLCAIAIPNFIHARSSSQMSGCINNLRMIDASIQQWAIENHAEDGAAVTRDDLTPYLGRDVSGSLASVFCPADNSRSFDSSYTVTDISTKPTCKISPADHAVN